MAVKGKGSITIDVVSYDAVESEATSMGKQKVKIVMELPVVSQFSASSNEFAHKVALSLDVLDAAQLAQDIHKQIAWFANLFTPEQKARLEKIRMGDHVNETAEI